MGEGAQRRIAWAAGVCLTLAPLPVHAQPEDYGAAFVAAFEAACVPGRLSYESTLDAARAAGWVETRPDRHPELAAMTAIGEAAAEEAAADPDLKGKFEQTAFEMAVAGGVHFLVAARSTFEIEGFGDDDLWVLNGCYLYNFDAPAPIDPAPVTALIGKPISHSVDTDGLLGHVWGPPCPMPRTGDTYLSFIAEGSSYIDQTGFSGLVLKFETSEPEPGEVVPETYCTDDPPAAET